VAIGLDTSVVLRLLVGVPEAQARLAQRRLEHAIEQGEPVIVCDLVIAEAYYALQFHYEVPKAEARNMLMRFVRSGVVAVEPRNAAEALVPTSGAGLVDRLIHARHRALGAVTLTFERKLGALEGAVRLSAS
jgi:predicted nucleic acid-binding protein